MRPPIAKASANGTPQCWAARARSASRSRAAASRSGVQLDDTVELALVPTRSSSPRLLGAERTSSSATSSSSSSAASCAREVWTPCPISTLGR